jgi:hypothetical protein
VQASARDGLEAPQLEAVGHDEDAGERHRGSGVVVGTGLAGGAAARSLRENGFDGRVTLLGDEPHPPYERPPLSKEYLRGESAASDAYVEPADFWAKLDVDLVTTTDMRAAMSTPPWSSAWSARRRRWTSTRCGIRTCRWRR